MTMNASCPSDLALERHLLTPEASPLGEHLAACPRCIARLVEMRRQGEEFQQYVFPVTVAAIEAAAHPGRWRPWRRLVAPLALAAGLAALTLFVLRWGPLDRQFGSEGDLGLSVLVQDGHSDRAVHDGDGVSAAAALSFRVRTASACRLWILSLDSRGEVVRLYPGEGTGGAAVDGPVQIPGGSVLDGQAGPERIYAVCTPGPSRWRALATQLKGEAGAGEAAVRAAPDVTRLPPGTLLASVLIEKHH
jgi:hypothetical protein